MIIEAIKSNNQGKVNRAVNWLLKYNRANTNRNDADGEGNEKIVRQVR